MKPLLPTTLLALLLTVAAGVSEKPAVEAPMATAPALTRPDTPGHKLDLANPALPGAASSPVGLDAG
jgi:hypothetical protein